MALYGEGPLLLSYERLVDVIVIKIAIFLNII
jgi:hypothetical protein